MMSAYLAEILRFIAFAILHNINYAKLYLAHPCKNLPCLSVIYGLQSPNQRGTVTTTVR